MPINVHVTRRMLVLSMTAGAVLALHRSDAPSRGRMLPLYTRCSFGAFTGSTWAHTVLESRVGAKLKRYVMFVDLPPVGGTDGFPQDTVDWCRQTGHDLVIAWDIHTDIDLTGDQILRGEIDSQLDSFFDKCRDSGIRIALRMWWEFNDANGRKVGQSPTAWPGGTAQFTEAWRHVYNRAQAFNQQGNISFFWCANGSDTSGYRMEEFWPGAEYVDMVGVNTYNDHWAPWTQFADKIAPMMERIQRLPGAGTKPQGVGETGSLDLQGRKADWYHALFLADRWPNLRVVDFFSVNKEEDWRIDHPESVRQVCAEYLSWAPQDAWSAAVAATRAISPTLSGQRPGTT